MAEIIGISSSRPDSECPWALQVTELHLGVAEYPERVQEHLKECASCREWMEELRAFEEHVIPFVQQEVAPLQLAEKEIEAGAKRFLAKTAQPAKTKGRKNADDRQARRFFAPWRRSLVFVFAGALILAGIALILFLTLLHQNEYAPAAAGAPRPMLPAPALLPQKDVLPETSSGDIPEGVSRRQSEDHR